MEVDHCIRADGEDIRNILHRIKKTVNSGQRLPRRCGWSRSGWPECWTRRISSAKQTEIHWVHTTRDRTKIPTAKGSRIFDGTSNATWNDFSSHLINKDVSYQVSTNFLNDEERIKAQMASLGQDLKNLRTELREQRINAVEETLKRVAPKQKRKQRATRFCGFCRTNGHTPSYCRKNIRDEEFKKFQNEATAEKKVTFTQDYNTGRWPSHGSGNWTSQIDDDQLQRSLVYDKQISYNGDRLSTPNLMPEKNSDQTIRIITTTVEINILSEVTTRITTVTNTITTDQTHHISRTEISLETGAVTEIIHDCLQRRDKTHPSRISIYNSDQIRQNIQCLTVLQPKLRAKIHLKTRSYRPPITGISQT